MHECARRFGMSRTSLSYKLKKDGIRIKQKAEIIAEQNAGAPWRDEATMRSLYVEQKLSTIQMAERFGCDKSVVVDWLKRFGIEARTTAETQKGKTPATKGLGKRNSGETVFCACGCGTEIKRYNHGSNEVRFVNGHRVKGEAHPRYKPVGTADIRQHEGSQYREWRRAVLKNSAYTCTGCGKIGGKLHSHHVMPLAKHPEFAFEPWNGKAVCAPCHKEIHSAARELLK